MAHDMGIETRLDGIPAETLGGLRLGVSPLEMSNAYATLASGGMRNEPIAIRKVVFPDGNVDETGQPKRKRVFEDGVAAEVTEILSDNVDGGTGTAAQTDCSYEAGKTGTTDDFNDAMFIGYTPQLSTAVWVGYPNELRSMTSVHGISVAGGTFPAQIWHDYMQVALHQPEVNKGEFCPPFPEPQNPVEWIPFHGSYSSDSSSSSCPDADVTGTGSSEGSYSCSSSSSTRATTTITRRPPSPTATARTRGHMRPVSARSPRRRRSRTRHRRRHRLRHRRRRAAGSPRSLRVEAVQRLRAGAVRSRRASRLARGVTLISILRGSAITRMIPRLAPCRRANST